MFEIHSPVRRFLLPWYMRDVDRHHDVRRLRDEPDQSEDDAGERRRQGTRGVTVGGWWGRRGGEEGVTWRVGSAEISPQSSN